MELIQSARNSHRTPSSPGVERTDEEERTRRGVVAQERVMQDQVSRARQVLTGAALAPKTLETLEELRRKRCQRQVQAIPLDVMEFIPETPVELDARVFAISLRSAPRGSAAGPGCTYEMLQVCLDDVELLQMLTSAAEDFARDCRWNIVPQVGGEEFGEAVQQGSGTSMRSVPVRPFNEGRHRLRGARDTSSDRRQPHCIGAYDHLFRGAMLSKLLSEPALHGLLPFVRAMYSEESHYTWRDDSENLHDIVQCEGGEQGDPLMPLLFSLGIHDALSEAKNMMGEEEHLLAFLDDVFIVSEPDNTLGDELSTRAGIHLHAGKTRVWNREGVCPPGVEELGPEVWSPRGVKILGTPLGSDAFVQEDGGSWIAVRVQDGTRGFLGVLG